jgi:uncharacterized membrane protein YkvA (DUF1232 family)
VTRDPRPPPTIVDAGAAKRPSTGDPFPRERLAALIRRLPRYARLAWRLGHDPSVSRLRRAAVAGAAIYVISPIDLLPGIIPGIGQLDDALIAIAALRLALSGLDPERRQEHLGSAGLADADLVDDLHTLRDTAGWLVRTGGRSAFRLSGRLAAAARGLGEGRAARR